MDCPATEFDSCLVQEYCWFQDKRPCPTKTQLAVSEFLHCFEGPFANKEAPTNASRREPCMQQAGLDYDRVMNCTLDKDRLRRAQHALNNTRAPMYRRLGPSPGYFPHIFVDGKHLYNMTWAAMVKVLCARITEGKGTSTGPIACQSRHAELSFRVQGIPRGNIEQKAVALERAVQIAADYSVSKEALPVNYEYPNWPHNEQPDPNGEPSYVNVEAMRTVRLVSATAAGGNGVDIKMSATLLEAFAEDFNQIGQTLPRYLSWSLALTGVAKINAENISQVRIVA